MPSRHNILILSAAIVFLLVAVGLEHPFFHRSGQNWRSIVFSEESLVGLTREIAFALLIAFVISVTVEGAARRADRESAERMRKEIALDVFKGVFSRVFPADYVDKVVAINLEPSLIREFIQATHILEEPDTGEMVSLGLQVEDYILLRSRTRYRLKNISSRNVDENVRVSLPAVSSAAGAVSRLVHLHVGPAGGTLTDYERIAVRSTGRQVRTYSHGITIEPGAAIDVSMETLSLKEASDNDVWGTIYPTLRGDVTLTVRRHGIAAGLHARTATAIETLYEAEDGSAARWQIDGPMLANDSLTLWWQPKAT